MQVEGQHGASLLALMATGAFDMQKANLLVYSHGHYYEMGREIGKFGWSVQKKNK